MVAREAQSVLTYKKLYSRRGSKIFHVQTVISRLNYKIQLSAGIPVLARRLEKTELPLGLLILDVQRGARMSFHLAAPPVLGFSRSPPL